MSAPDAMSETLNYANVKRRAVASRSYRVRLSPSNGQSYISGNTVNFTMPSNLAGTYCDWSKCYLKYKVKSDIAGNLDRGGCTSLINRVQVFTSGSSLMDLSNWGVLMNILMDMDSNSIYKANTGKTLMGTSGGSQKGEALVAGVERTFCMPFVLHTLALSQPARLQPLFSSSSVEFRLTLEDGKVALKTATAGQTPTLTYSEVELICHFVELSAGANAIVDQMCGGQYNMLCSSYQNVGTTMADGDRAVTANLGISVSSLERVIVCHRPTTSISASNAYSIGNRSKNFLSEFSIYINGESFPSTSIKIGDKGAEALAEFLLSDHSLVNFDKQSSFNLAIAGTTASTKTNGLDGQSIKTASAEPYLFEGAGALGTEDGTTDASGSNIGTFIAGIEMESFAGKSDKLYSGISTIASSVSYRGVYDAGTLACQIDFFAQYSVLLSLNTRGTNVWAISV